jgi:hypothetical protein
MIANQQTSAMQLLIVGAKQPPDVVLGAGILSVSIAYDSLLCQGCTHLEAVRLLRLKKQQYNSSVIDSLEELKPSHDSMEIRSCPISDLRSGMILREEVRTHGGLLVVAKGQEISSALLLRLRNFRERNQISGSVLVLAPDQTASLIC